MTTDERDKVMRAVFDSAQQMRENGHAEPLVALVGYDLDPAANTTVITDYGCVKLYNHVSVAPHTVVTMAETDYLEMLERERVGE